MSHGIALLVLASLLGSVLAAERWTPYTRTRIVPGLRYHVRGVEHVVDPDATIVGRGYLLKQEVLDDLYHLIRTADEVLRATGIRYVASHGTLLGAVRNQGILPFDDDGDAYVLDRKRFFQHFGQLEEEFGARGCFLWKKGPDAPYYKLSRLGAPSNFPYLDLYFYPPGKLGDDENLVPPARLEFEDFEIDVPRRYRRCLDIFYRKREDDDPLKVMKMPFLCRWVNNKSGAQLHLLGLRRLLKVTKWIEGVLGLNEGNQT